MATDIFPTDNDVGDSSAVGGVVTEAHLRDVFRSLQGGRTSCVLSGMACTDGGGLTLNIAAGEAYINGFVVTFSATETFTATVSVTRYVWIRLDYTTGNVSGHTIVDTTSGAPIDADHCLIGKYTADGTEITSADSDDVYPPGQVVSGTYVGDNGTNRLIPMGFTPRFVMVRGVVVTNEYFSTSAILSKGDVPSDITGVKSIVFTGISPGHGAAASDVWDGRDSQRPEIAVGGFEVTWASSTNNDINELNSTYRFIAWA